MLPLVLALRSAPLQSLTMLTPLRRPPAARCSESDSPGISAVAPFLRSEGFTVCLEGLTDSGGGPIIYAHGVPHGNADEVWKQVQYTHERVLAQCAVSGIVPPEALTIVNVRTPSFRFPDGPNRRALRQLRQQFPWSSRGRMLFVDCPTPVLWAFDRLKPLLSPDQVASIGFVDTAELPQFVPSSSLPVSMGGSAEWSMEAYIAARCAAEGEVDCGSVRQYHGPRLPIELLDNFDRQEHARQVPVPMANGEVDSIEGAAHTGVASAADNDQSSAPRGDRRGGACAWPSRVRTGVRGVVVSTGQSLRTWTRRPFRFGSRATTQAPHAGSDNSGGD